jgi:peptide/nickel transport system permease protein
MISYLLGRFGQAVIVLFGVSLILFGLIHLLPGGPARALLGNHVTRPAIQAFNREYGLDRPLPVQYFSLISQWLSGNLGFSYRQHVSVDTLIAANLPRTLVLAGTSTVLAIGAAIPIGLYQAIRRNRADDHLITALTFFFYAMPTFFLGLALIVLLSQMIPIFPPTGPNTSAPLFTQIPNLVLPVATLTLVTLAQFTRYVRSSAISSSLEDYVRTARAKGATSRRIWQVHVLRNALLPVITLVGLSIPTILGGALITEALFNYPGMGLLFWNAAQDADFPVMLGTAIVVAVAVVVGTLIADLLYLVADPRIRYT